MKAINILITGAGTVTCQSVIKGLRLQNDYQVRIVTVDMKAINAGRPMSDAFYQIPAANDDQFINKMLNICQKEQIDLLIPIVDYEFEKFALLRDEFEAIGTKVLISDYDSLRKANNKWLTYNFFKELEIKTPVSYLPEDINLEKITFPLFIKPCNMGRASIDSYLIEDMEDLRFYLRKVKEPLLQQAIKGKEYTVDVLCDFDGNPLGGVVRERELTKSGVSYIGHTLHHPEMLEQAKKIAKALKIIGPANIQCFENDEGIFFFEVNPRYSGTLVLSIAAGFNSPRYLLDLIAGNQPEIKDYKAVSMYRFWEEMYYDEKEHSFFQLY